MIFTDKMTAYSCMEKHALTCDNTKSSRTYIYIKLIRLEPIESLLPSSSPGRCFQSFFVYKQSLIPSNLSVLVTFFVVVSSRRSRALTSHFKFSELRSSRSLGPMNFTRIEDSAATDAGFERNIKHEKKGSKQKDHDMSQTIDLFRKYLLTKSRNHSVGKTNKEEESEVLKKKKSPPRALIPLIPPKFGSNFSRPASLLERELLPGIRGEAIETGSSSGEKSSTAQLTVFYGGVINVYDNVPNDKAQAIMLLAGESSLSKPMANEKAETEAKTPPLHRPNVESSCKLQADLPIARKISLKHFLEKRRGRIVNNSPYKPAANHRDREKENELKLDHDNSNKNDHTISLSPFPSRLGYFSPVAANRGCEA